MSPELISDRARAIRLSRKAWAGQCGLSEKALGMILNGRSGGMHQSFVKAEEALIADEIRLRDYLLALHPVQPASEEKAA
jgi:hypothetical protein